MGPMSGSRLQELHDQARADGSGIAIAEGGASRQAPRNSMSAISLALRQGAQAILLDVQITRDQVPVAFRGDLMDDTGAHPVSGFSLEELQEIDIGSPFSLSFRGERIPRLEDILATFGSDTVFLINLEPAAHRQRNISSLMAGGAAGLVGKRMVDPLVRAVARCIHFCGVARNVAVCAGNVHILDAVERADAAIPRIIRVGASGIPQGCPDVQGTLLGLGPTGAVLPEMLRHPCAGKPLLAGPVEDPALVPELLACGVTGLVGSDPYRLTRTLAHTHHHLQHA